MNSRTAVAVNVAFAAGNELVNQGFLERFAAIDPGIPLFTVSEFAPARGEWIPWHVHRDLQSNLDTIRAALSGYHVVKAGFVLQGHGPLRGMKRAAFRTGADRIIAFDHRLEPVPFSAAGVPRLLQHAAWRARTFAGQQVAEGGRTRKWLRRILHPRDAEVPFLARRAQAAGRLAGLFRGTRTQFPMRVQHKLLPGVSVIIPSRDGKELLQQLFRTLLPQISQGEVIVSDNGSLDGTNEWLAEHYPSVRVIHTATPLSFARAVNRGIQSARYSHAFLLNNDMLLEPDCLASLEQAFRDMPELFCATAQIFFPEGARREETGKAVWRAADPLEFPLRCDEPLPGEDRTWVIYGSGGCSLFDTGKLHALGGVAERYDPAYVEDLDLGYRAWKMGWPTVYCAGARVEHRHRATTSRFYTARQLQFFVERNFLRFLVDAVGSKPLFAKLWAEAIRRLQLLADAGELAALDALRNVPAITGLSNGSQGPLQESAILALGAGDVAIFPGRGRSDRPVIIASPYLPYPLSHGGAVRMFHLAREAHQPRGQVLISFVDQLESVPSELLDIFAEVVLVRRHGSHYRRQTDLPDTVEEFRSEAFEAALRLAVWKWQPAIVQLEFTQMAQYARACSPAKTILVEHDITFDLQRQLVALEDGSAVQRSERARQLALWESFETIAWRGVDRIAVMSEKDRAIAGPKAVVLPNGVDTDRFQPSDQPCDPQRILFIGSLAHLPNLLGLVWFVGHVWPLLEETFKLHVIAGHRHEYYLEFYRESVTVNLAQPRIEVEGFVGDVRPAYRRAEIVIAPLTASAGTNIKVLEAMAMGKCTVSTPAGINGLDLQHGEELLVAGDATRFAEAIQTISSTPKLRRALQSKARLSAVAKYDWRAVGRLQAALYEDLSC